MIGGVTYVPLSDIGMEREENQDYQGHDLTPHGMLVIVADGMGGHAGGATASQMTVNILKRALRESDQTHPSKALEHGIRVANHAIWRTSQERMDLRGMGSTVVAMLLTEERAYIAHVGDSRIYMLRDRELMRLTKDHTMVQRLVDDGILTEEAARNHHASHVLSRSLGGLPDVLVETAPYAIRTQPGDIFLLCSDGLTGPLEDHEVGHVLAEYEPHEAARIFVDEANARGGYDNTTVALVRIDELPLSDIRTPKPVAAEEGPAPPPPPAAPPGQANADEDAQDEAPSQEEDAPEESPSKEATDEDDNDSAADDDAKSEDANTDEGANDDPDSAEEDSADEESEESADEGDGGGQEEAAEGDDDDAEDEAPEDASGDEDAKDDSDDADNEDDAEEEDEEDDAPASADEDAQDEPESSDGGEPEEPQSLDEDENASQDESLDEDSEPSGDEDTSEPEVAEGEASAEYYINVDDTGAVDPRQIAFHVLNVDTGESFVPDRPHKMNTDIPADAMAATLAATAPAPAPAGSSRTFILMAAAAALIIGVFLGFVAGREPVSGLENQIDIATERLGQLDTQLGTVRAERDATTRKLADTQSQVRDLETERDGLKKEQNELSARYSAAQELIKAQREELEAMRKAEQERLEAEEKPRRRRPR